MGVCVCTEVCGIMSLSNGELVECDWMLLFESWGFIAMS